MSSWWCIWQTAEFNAFSEEYENSKIQNAKIHKLPHPVLLTLYA